jgi:hypothetical protein
MKTQRESRVIAVLYFNLSTRWVGYLMPYLCCFTPRKETRYPFNRRVGGSQLVSIGRENPAPTGV